LLFGNSSDRYDPDRDAFRNRNPNSNGLIYDESAPPPGASFVNEFVPVPGPAGQNAPGGLSKCNNQTVDANLRSSVHPAGTVLVLESVPGNERFMKSLLPNGTTIVPFTTSGDIAFAIAKYPAGTFDCIIIEGHRMIDYGNPSYVFAVESTTVPGEFNGAPLTSAVNGVIASRLTQNGVLIVASCDAAYNPKLGQEAIDINHPVIAPDVQQGALVTDPGGHWYFIPPIPHK
jgi:hypothetical protein